MRRPVSPLLIFSVILTVPAFSPAQTPWAGILDPSRAVNWSGAGIPGGIPNRTTVCATVNPSGNTDATDSNNIESALWGCPANEVVQLSVGTFTLTKGIIFNTNGGLTLGGSGTVSRVTLRGAGPDKTILKFTGLTPGGCPSGGDDICIGGSSAWSGNYAGSTTWTAGYSKGSTTITVGSTSGLSVGQIIILDQRNDSIGIVASPNGATESGSTVTITTSTPHGYSVGQKVGVGGVGVSGYNGWFTITAVPTSTTFQYTAASSGLTAGGGGSSTVDTGGVYITDVTNPVAIEEQASEGRTCPDSADPSCAAGEISRRSQMEYKQITAINGNQITISPGLYMPNWRASQAPGIWWTTANFATQDGVESMTLDFSNDGGGSSNGGVGFMNCYECWEKNMRSIDGSRNHVWIAQSARTEVVDSYFFGTKSGAAKSYGVETLDSSDSLVQNNICQHVVACLMTGLDYGGVYGYNYAVDSGYSPTDWLIGMLFQNHDFASYDLIEGNDVDATNLDNVHGTGAANTAFRNRFRGQDTPAKATSLVAVMDNSFNRAENFVGNVLGTVGAETSYQQNGSGPLYPSGVIWHYGSQAESFSVPDDPLVGQSLLRWGNYDVVNGSAQWNSAEVPTTGITFINANPAPSSQTLPNSFYLSSQPAFWQTTWSTPPWPAIGPDVTGGTAPDGAGGHSYSIPSQICAANTSIDPAYQQTFTVSGATWSSGTVTLTIGSNALATTNTITVTGVTPSAYNGTFAVTGETATTVSYALSNSPGTYSSGGTVAYPNILLFNAANCYPAEYGAQVAAPTNLSATPH